MHHHFAPSLSHSSRYRFDCSSDRPRPTGLPPRSNSAPIRGSRPTSEQAPPPPYSRLPAPSTTLSGRPLLPPPPPACSPRIVVNRTTTTVQSHTVVGSGGRASHAYHIPGPSVDLEHSGPDFDHRAYTHAQAQRVRGVRARGAVEGEPARIRARMGLTFRLCMVGLVVVMVLVIGVSIGLAYSG